MLNSSSKVIKPFALGAGSVIVISIILLSVVILSAKNNVTGSNIAVNATIHSTTTITPSPTTTKNTFAYAKAEPTKGVSLVQSSAKNAPNPTSSQQGNASSSQPTATTTPAQVTPTATPTPQGGTSIRGSYRDGSGNQISLPNMKIKISNPDKGISQESTSAPSFEFNNLPSGAYQIEVQQIDGYSIQHEVCFNCSEDGSHYYSASSFMVNITENHTLVGINFKYIQN